jgi:dTDP-4-amino-4,6-dideoxygalactose transaminase
MAPLIYGGIPIFADIEPETFCLDPQAVQRAISPRTKAIIAVNLFGHAAPLQELMALAQAHNLFLIEDNAQAPLATEAGRYCGTIGHIGVFSLNYHKHIHTGEGGMIVTQDDNLARRLQMIRNHGENVVDSLQVQDLTNLIGFNYRMTELSAAVGLAQLKQIEQHVGQRQRLAQHLMEGIKDLAGLTSPQIRPDCTHVYYLWGVRFDEKIVGITREQFSQALAAEGFPHFCGYVPPLYLLPIFQKRVAIGAQGYPFNLTKTRYEAGLCPVTERMYYQELLCFETCMYDVSPVQAKLLVEAIHKVYRQREALRD